MEFKKGMAFIPQTTQNFTKREIQVSHKIVVLSELLIDAVDELITGDLPLKDIPEHPLNQVMRFCETLSNRSQKFNQVRATNYLPTLVVKVDTVIRKNFKPIEDLTTYTDYGNHK